MTKTVKSRPGSKTSSMQDLAVQLETAVTFQRSGQLDQAEAIYQGILKEYPGHADAWHLLGLLHHNRGALTTAIQCLTKAISFNDKIPDYHTNQGVVLKMLGNLEAAEMAQRRALELRPDHASALNNLANILLMTNRAGEADETYSTAIRSHPDYPEAWRNRANVRLQLGRLDDAYRDCRHALSLKQNYADAWHTLSRVLLRKGDVKEAEAANLSALKLSPDHHDALNNAGIIALLKDETEAAEKSFRQTISKHPARAEGHYGLGLSLLRQGKFSEGLIECERRLTETDNEIPIWQTEDLRKKTILVTAEGTISDMILFSRYALLLAKKAGKVILECPGDLAALFGSPPKNMRFIEPGKKAPKHHFRISLISLLHRLGATLDTIPAAAYLQPDPKQVKTWQKALEKKKGDILIGVAWRGGPAYEHDQFRSIQLDTLTPLLSLTNCRFISLQKERNLDELAALPNDVPLLEPPMDLSDLGATAALVANLDLVITVDTMIAHLAGTMGKTVWLLLPKGADWRWLEGTDTSPWYPTARLFRQNSPGDWARLISKVSKEVVKQGYAKAAPKTKKRRKTTQKEVVPKRHIRASQHINEGRFEAGEALLNKALKKTPTDPQALYLLGTSRLMNNDFSRAADFLQQAVQADATQSEYFSNLGAALRRTGNIQGAIDAYQQALKITPDNAVAINNLGNVLLQIGRIEDAEKSFQRAVSIVPEYADAYRNLAEICRQKKQYDQALKFADLANRYRKNYTEAHLVQAAILRDQGNYKEAIVKCREVLGQAPRAADAHIMMGTVLLEMGQLERAEAYLRGAFTLSKGNVQAGAQLGRCLTQQNRIEEALAVGLEVVKVNPNSALAHRNLGNVFKEAGNLGEAQKSLEYAVELAPHDGTTHMELAFCLIHKGDLEYGYREYEWRFKTAERLGRTFPKPDWDGTTSPKGKTVLVYCEQGMGANIMYSRYLPMLAKKGAGIILETYPPLKKILSTVDGVDQVFVRNEKIPDYDYQASMLSMPFLFGTKPDNIPSGTPFLKADPEKVAYWADKLKRDKRPLIGIAWQGNPRFGGDTPRSMPLRHYIPLLRSDAFRVVSLQVGFGREQLVHLPEDIDVEDPANELRDFTDTAALMENLDLILSTDTAVTHMAGALNRPAWILLSHTPDWRYQQTRPDFPWYPTLRLFRQKKRGDWDQVVADVMKAMKKEI